MSYFVKIQDNKTKEIIVHEENRDWEEHSDFWWTEGNMSCDCNRQRFFEPGGHASDHAIGFPCGDTRYSIIDITAEDGTVLMGKEVIFLSWFLSG